MCASTATPLNPSFPPVRQVDLKADPSVYRKLSDLTRDHPNIRLLSTRRLVQWGGFTMVSTMLDAIASIVARNLDFDFFINLSDADMSLRTNSEVMEFLRPYKGRQFVQVRAKGDDSFWRILLTCSYAMLWGS